MAETAAGILLGALLSALALGGCAAAPGATDDGVLRIHATTGYIADAVANIAPAAEVSTLVGPGGDPHTYQASTRDIQQILDADAVFSNGLHLEPQLTDLLATLGERHLAVGSVVPPELLLEWPAAGPDGQPLADPHIWNSPEAWQLVVEGIADKLAQLDPAGAADYRANALDYARRLDEAAEQARRHLATVPDDRRILVTGHDAFAYFGETFELAVHATDFISTEARLSATELSSLADLIVDHRLPVIFHDNQASPQAITSLQEAVRARGWDVEVSDAELYADSLGAEPDVDTHLEVIEHNARAVADALGEEHP